MTGVIKPLAPADEELILSPGDPLPSARAFVERYYTRDRTPTIWHHSGLFYAWTGSCYPEADASAIRARAYSFLESAVRWDAREKKLVPFQPTTTRVNDLLDALKAATNLPRDNTAPSWIGVPQEMHPPAHEIIACENGLLHLPTLDMRPPSPAFFSHNALDYAYDPNAPDPEHWLRFLDNLWGADPESVDTLQEIFGYLLTTDTRQQKIFMVVGPKRSGKGTIGRILTRVLGQANVCAPTLASLAGNFGLAPLVARQLAIIADARLGARADQYAIAERLLSISGEDNLTIDRKYLPAWTGRLPTRFVIMTNELPRLTDSSGALASRFIVLRLTESFYGREDPGLTDRLLAEAPGILNWACEGWHRLQERGHFSQPQSAAEAIQDLEDLASPVGAFIRERCQVDPYLEVHVNTLFSEWRAWCDEQGRDRPGTAATFGRDLRAAVPTIARVRPREDDGKRRWIYQGIGLAPQ